MSKRKRTRKPFEATLPAASCSKELREKLEVYAEAMGISFGDVVRQAVEIFLLKNYQKVADNNQKVRDE